MGLTYHFSFIAPSATTAATLETFLRHVEIDARAMGFRSTTIVNGPFDTQERQVFARRVSRGLTVEDERLSGVGTPTELCWSYGNGYCRLAPEYGVLLIVSDERDYEIVFGFFRYPRIIHDGFGHKIIETPGEGAWTASDRVKSPDQRYRAIIRRFAASGYLASERDEFVLAAQRA